MPKNIRFCVCVRLIDRILSDSDQWSLLADKNKVLILSKLIDIGEDLLEVCRVNYQAGVILMNGCGHIWSYRKQPPEAENDMCVYKRDRIRGIQLFSK